MDVILTICALLALVGVNALFVTAEFALIGARTRTPHLQTLVKAGHRDARLVLKVIEQLDDYLSATQFGRTLASLALGWFGVTVLVPLLLRLFYGLPPPFTAWLAHGLAALVAFACLVFLHLVLGQLVPKAVALLYPENLSRWVTPLLTLFTYLFWPVIRLLNQSANGILGLFAIHPPAYTERIHAPEELRLLLLESRDHGLVEESDAEMIAGVLDLSRTSVRQAMTPRTEIWAVQRDWPLGKIIDLVRNSGFSRLPVYDEDLDHIVGMLLAKDLLNFFESDTPFSTDLVMREPYFTSATMQVDDLMKELQQRNAHLAIVVDEYGGTLGLITLEDLIEEIVGEIFDEFDHTEASEGVQHIAAGRLRVPGDFPIQELNERYQLQLSAGDYVTVAGLVLSALGHIPTVGQWVQVNDVTIRVTAMDRQRIERLEITLPQTEEESAASVSETPAQRAEPEP